jgi:ribosome recycling factor
MPPLGGGAYLIEILFEVGPSKPTGMGGSAPIDDVDLAAWMANQNVRLKPWEAQTIRKISREYAAMLSEAVEPNTPPPWVDPDLLNQERREKIAKAMSNWADNINAKTRN